MSFKAKSSNESPVGVGIGHDKLAWIRVDVTFESQIHQHGSRQNDIQCVRRDAGGDVPAFLIQQQQQDLFRKPQHIKPPTGTCATGSRFLAGWRTGLLIWR